MKLNDLIDEIIETFWEVVLHPEDHPKLIFTVLIVVMILAILMIGGSA